MKKMALSLLVIAASGAYVWDQSRQQPEGDPLGAALLEGEAQAAALSTTVAEVSPAPTMAPLPSDQPDPVGQPAADCAPQPVDQPATQSVEFQFVQQPVSEPATQPAELQPVPQTRPVFRAEPVAVAQAAMTVAQNAGFTDGTYTGPAINAYYGLVQIQAIVQGGQLIGLKALQYPNDRRTSIAINRQALPMLRDEAVAAQSANVDIITGATLTSQAFIRSLDGALGKAR